MRESLKKQYQEKLITAACAAKLVNDGDHLELGFGGIYPVEFDAALAARAEELHHVVIRNGVLADQSKLLEIGAPFEWRSWYATGSVRKKIAEASAVHIPIRYSEVPRYVLENVETDIVVIPVSEMDEKGYFNFGLSSSHLDALIQRAKTVIVEVNANQPRVFGRSESEIYVSAVDYIIEAVPHPLAEIPPRGYGEIDIAIAGHVVERITDGSTLQLGIGALPNAIGDMIADSHLKDLGVHTEMYVDSFMHMTEKGKINGSRKNIDKGRQVFTFLEGSRALYDFADKNPALQAASVDYVNDADVMAKNDRFVSINSALHVNLRGEVSSESVGFKHISGAGGQLDFALGSYLSKEGQGFICLHASRVDKNGIRTSNIVPDFERGTIITMPAPVTHYIVTEYGVANLKGKSTLERAKALIAIAHPDCREDLIQQAKEKGVWR